MPAAVHAGTHGRARTVRGEQRREALLKAVEAHLAVTPWREATVYNVARLADCAPGVFYQHFEDLDAAARALIERARAARAPLSEHLEVIARLLEVEQQLPGAP